jgi:hypothetical protein
MDYNEFEQSETMINTERKYSDEIEFVVKELNYMAQAASRYSRSVQLPIAIHIVRKLDEMRALEKK